MNVFPYTQRKREASRKSNIPLLLLLLFVGVFFETSLDEDLLKTKLDVWSEKYSICVLRLQTFLNFHDYIGFETIPVTFDALAFCNFWFSENPIKFSPFIAFISCRFIWNWELKRQNRRCHGNITVAIATHSSITILAVTSRRRARDFSFVFEVNNNFLNLNVHFNILLVPRLVHAEGAMDERILIKLKTSSFKIPPAYVSKSLEQPKTQHIKSGPRGEDRSGVFVFLTK